VHQGFFYARTCACIKVQCGFCCMIFLKKILFVSLEN